MSAELLACLRLVDDGTDEITDEERTNLSTVSVEEDVPEAGGGLVSHSLNLGAKLAHTNLAKGTATLWKGPQRRFVVSSTAYYHYQLVRMLAPRSSDISSVYSSRGPLLRACAACTALQSFWRGLARLRAETDEQRQAASTLEVLASEQKLVTWLK